MSFRRAPITIHLYVGLAAAAFLMVTGLTGAVLSFGSRYDQWVHPSLWYVATRDARLPEEAILDQVEARFAPARVEQIDVGAPGVVHVLTLTSGQRVFVDPYDGSVRGVRSGVSTTETVLWYVERLHVALMAGSIGRSIVDVATSAMVLLIPTGLLLWWSNKRWRVGWSGSWRRVTWDLHNAIGVCACVTLLILCVTGLLLASDAALLSVTRTSPWRVPPLPRSVVPNPARPRLDLDRLAFAADRVLPTSATYAIRLPLRDRSPVQFLKRTPGRAGHSTVFLDQYAGTVLRVDDFGTLPGGYRAREWVRAVHTGDLLGTPSRVVMSLSSLGLVSLVITGVCLWSRKVIDR